MADNTVLNTNATTGDTIATDDISGVKYQRVKIVEGADGVNDGDVSAANPLPVDVKAALPAGTNAIGKVDVTSVIPGVTATSAGKAVGGTSTSSDTGSAPLAIRDDALTTLSESEDQYTHLRVDSTGALHVTGGGGGTEYTDDTSTHSSGSTAGGVIMAAATPTDAAVTANDIGTVAMSLDRRLHVDAQIAGQDADVTIADGGNVISVDDGGGTLTVDVGTALPAGTNGIGKVDVTSVTPGVTASSLGKASNAVATSADTGVALLAVREDEQAAITPASGDYTAIRCDKFGNLKTTQLPDATSVVKFAAIDAAISGDNTIQAAAGAGIKIRVLSAFLVAAGTVNVRFESGAGGTALTGQMNLVANSGFTLPYNPAGWFETADNTLLNLELSAAVSVDGCVSYVEV